MTDDEIDDIAAELTGDQWQRISQVMELVKQEGDARCEAAFGDLLAAYRALRVALVAVSAEVARLRERVGDTTVAHGDIAIAALERRAARAQIAKSRQAANLRAALSEVAALPRYR